MRPLLELVSEISLSRGADGNVCRWIGVRIHNETKQIVAIKQIDLEDSDDDISEIQQEIAHLAQVGLVLAMRMVLTDSFFVADPVTVTCMP